MSIQDQSETEIETPDGVGELYRGGTVLDVDAVLHPSGRQAGPRCLEGQVALSVECVASAARGDEGIFPGRLTKTQIGETEDGCDVV